MKPFSGGVIEKASLALKYVLSQPGIVILAGVENTRLFDENWEVFQGTHKLDTGEREEIERIRELYGKTFCRRCDYCQPCTEDIPIQIILGIRSIVKRMGKDALTGSWLVKAIDKARGCSECGECALRCPYGLPIPELIRENLKWVEQQLN